MPPDPDVLVVGAGPTGLVAAAELAKRGVAVRLIDQELQRSDKSRALVVQPRSLEVLARMGALGNLLEVGQRSLSIGLYVRGRNVVEIGVPDIGFEDTPFPYLLFVSQAETERVLEEHVRSLGVEVERGVELVELHHAGQDVEASLSANGATKRLRARYVVGADGAHSVVRKQAGLSFDGDAYQEDFALADVEVQWDLPDGGVRLFFDRGGVLVCLPMQGEHAYRFIMVRSQGATDVDPTLEEVTERARAATGRELRIKQAHWLARFRLHHRGVDRYRNGRLFVAGDAAHIHSPAGGQGMNTGIQDAFNLGWKLALVARGRAPDTLLDSYHEERHPVGQRLLASTDRMFRLGASRSWLLSVLRGAFLPIGAPFVLGNRKRRARAFSFVSQLGIRYEQSSLSEEPTKRGSLAKRPRAGQRAPDARLGAGTLFQHLTGPGFHLLCFSESPGPWESALPSTLRDLVTTWFVHRGPASSGALSDPLGEAFARYGVSGDAMVLIRPDGYIATRGEGRDPFLIRDYLERHGFEA